MFTERQRKCMNERDDAALVAAAAGGNPEDFAPIVQRYQDAVFAVALSRLRNFHDAQDVVQNVFLEAFQRIGGLNDPNRLGAWLRSITIHRSIDHLRRSGQTSSVIDASQEIEAIADMRMGERTGDLRDQVMAAIGKLSKTQRETTTLFYINGYSQQEVAAIQEVPVGTVKRRLHDARAKLKQEMLTMVEDVLKSEAPKEDAAQRVYELLAAFRPPEADKALPWERIFAELRRIGHRGLEGFVKALESPHSPIRRMATDHLRLCDVPEHRETIIQLLIRGMEDANRKVRRAAVPTLLCEVDVDNDRRRREFVPLASRLLTDPSKRVRRATAYVLWPLADAVPKDQLLRALLEEKDAHTLDIIRELARRSLIGAAEKDK